MNHFVPGDKSPPVPRANGPLRRSRFQGLLQVVRFNWPYYAIAAGILPLLGLVLRRLHCPVAVRSLLWLVIFAVMLSLFASLVVSHWVYDRSGIYELKWIRHALSAHPQHWVNLHAGFDEFTPGLCRIFPGSRWSVFDFHDARVITEPSIARAAKRLTGAPPAAKVRYDALPAGDGTLDAAFLIFAAHEIRSRPAREQFFRELLRVLRPGGSLLLVEHLRDRANLLGFALGAFHFLARREWLRVATAAGFKLEQENSLTPFVRVFLFRRPL